MASPSRRVGLHGDARNQNPGRNPNPIWRSAASWRSAALADALMPKLAPLMFADGLWNGA